MSTPINSFQDILDALEQNPEYQEAMRRHVLDEEFRQLPVIVRQLQETVADLAQMVRDYIVATNARLDRLEAGQAKLEAGQARLEAGQARMQGQLNNLTGTDYERKAARRIRRAASRRLNLLNATVIYAVTVPYNNTIPDLLDDAIAENRITEDEASELEATDIILSGNFADGADGSQPAYAVAEVSLTIFEHDVDRARERAVILAKAGNASVKAAVIGAVIHDEVRQYAEQSDVSAIIMAE